MVHVCIGIITFRRIEQLRRLILCLEQQLYPSFAVSIIVVDNDRAGSARSVCEVLDGQVEIDLRYFQEPEPGIVAARNRVVDEFLQTSGDYLAFIDDDEWPSAADWLSSLLLSAQKNRADIVAGDVLSQACDGTPAWATQILYSASKRKDGEDMPVFYTGNVLISRCVLEQFPVPFDPRFALTGASDYHFALRCQRSGFRAVFSNAPVIEEFPPERASVDWFMKRGFRSGSGFTRSHLFEDPAYIAVVRCGGLSFVRLARGSFTLLLGLASFNKARTVRGLFRISSAVGSLAGLGGLTYYEYRKQHAR